MQNIYRTSVEVPPGKKKTVCEAVEQKGKIVLIRITKAHRGSGGVTPLFNLGAIRR